MTAVTGLVLAGGASRRMGTDKALLRLDGLRLVDRAVGLMSAFCGRVLVAGGSRPVPGLDVAQIPDALPGSGPLGGIVAGLSASQTPLMAVVAVDMPHASAEVFAALIDRWRGEPALVPVVDGIPQPLHAVWATSGTAKLRDLMVGGERSVIAAARAAGAVFVPLPGNFTTNVNRPTDLGTDAEWTTGWIDSDKPSQPS